MGRSNTDGRNLAEALEYQVPQARSARGSWIWLAVSLLPLIFIASIADIMGGGMRGVFEMMARPFALVFSRPVAAGIGVAAFIGTPIALSFVFAWMARQGFRRQPPERCKMGRLLSWAAVFLFGGMLVLVVILVPVTWWMIAP